MPWAGVARALRALLSLSVKMEDIHSELLEETKTPFSEVCITLQIGNVASCFSLRRKSAY